MRPMFAYLNALVVPTAVFAATEDWGRGDLPADAGLADRIARAGADLASAIAARRRTERRDEFADPIPFDELLARVRLGPQAWRARITSATAGPTQRPPGRAPSSQRLRRSASLRERQACRPVEALEEEQLDPVRPRAGTRRRRCARPTTPSSRRFRRCRRCAPMRPEVPARGPFQPMVVGSSVGRSAAHGAGGPGASRSSAQQPARLRGPLELHRHGAQAAEGRADFPEAAAEPPRDVRLRPRSERVQPAATQLRPAPRRGPAAGRGAPSHRSMRDHVGRAFIQAPWWRLRTTRPRAERIASSRGRMATLAAHFPLPTGGRSRRQEARRRRAPMSSARPASDSASRTATSAEATQAPPSAATPARSMSRTSPRTPSRTTRGPAAATAAGSVARGRTNSVRRMASCLTMVRSSYSARSRSSTANPSTRAHCREHHRRVVGGMQPDHRVGGLLDGRRSGCRGPVGGAARAGRGARHRSPVASVHARRPGRMARSRRAGGGGALQLTKRTPSDILLVRVSAPHHAFFQEY